MVALEDVIAVRKRLMKAVFFFREESSDGLVGNKSISSELLARIDIGAVMYTSIPGPDLSVYAAQFACIIADQYDCAAKGSITRDAHAFSFGPFNCECSQEDREVGRNLVRIKALCGERNDSEICNGQSAA